MGSFISRRGFVASLATASAAASGLVVWPPRPAFAARPSAGIPALPIAPRIACEGSGATKKSAVDQAFIDEQLKSASELFGPFGVRFSLESSNDLDARYLALETRADRDALADELTSRVINVFFVATLRDVDDPALYRRGVTWRKLTDLNKKYIVVAASAGPTTMAHELGHYFGLDHTGVKNNLMSYDRDGGVVFLDPKQGRTIRQHAEALYRSKALVPRST